MKYLNIRIIITLGLFGIAYISIAQKGAEITPWYVSVYMDQPIYSIVEPNATLENILDHVTDQPETNFTSVQAQQLHQSMVRGIWQMTTDTFADKLDIVIKDAGTLQGKIKYCSGMPCVLKLKKMLKNAPGEDYYLKLAISMTKGGLGLGIPDVEIGGKVKPVTKIDLVIANGKGKVLQEFEIKEKTDIVVGNSKTNLGTVESGKTETPDEVSARLLQVYRNALDELIKEYLKKNKKAYKA